MRLFDKLFCMHDWSVIEGVGYRDCVVLLLKCNKCGRIVKKNFALNGGTK